MENRTFERGGLVIDFTATSSRAKLAFKGVSDARDPGSVIGPVMVELLPRCRRKILTVDFTALEFMNSATVAPVLQFIRELHAQGTQTTLVYDTQREWQRINQQCMRVLLKPLTNISIKNDDA